MLLFKVLAFIACVYYIRNWIIFVLKQIYKLFQIGEYVIKQVKEIYNGKAYCGFCKYSVKSDNGQYLCLKHGEITRTPVNMWIIPKFCSEVNRDNECKDFKFSLFWFLK